jgi:cellulose synthase/poly-beta-1,6-N-acetylglucosamine synthase-like glycosyltransferase
MADLKVSIIIPVKPGGEVSALARLREVDYPSETLEILVAHGCSPSRQRNKAAAAALGEILYFLDDDSRVTPDFLSRVARHYDDPSVAAVGGPSLTPATDTPLQHAFGLAFASRAGGGGMRNRYRRTGSVRATCDRELILCNLSFRRDVFLGEGGFDERLYPNEENELMERVRRGGGVLIHDPDLAVERSQRPTLEAFCRQLFSYGRGRGEQTVISGVIKPVTLVPSLFLLYLLLLPFVRRPVYWLPLVCFVVLTVAVAFCAVVRTRQVRAPLLLHAVLPLFHVCYGAGLLKGLVAPRFRKRDSAECAVTIRRVKEFGEPLAE